jgi:hypothetical protein
MLGLHRFAAGVTRQSLRLHDRMAALGSGGCLHPDTLVLPSDVTRRRWTIGADTPELLPPALGVPVTALVGSVQGDHDECQIAIRTT